MRKILTSFIIVMIILSFSIISNATALQATITVEPDKKIVEPGDTVTFTLYLKDVAYAEGDVVGAIEGTISYDTNFFEDLKSPDGITINTTTNKFGKMGSFTNNATIGTITLKVKSTATGTGTVQFTNLAADDGRDDYTQSTATSSDVTINIAIKDTQEENNTIENNIIENNTIENNTIENNTIENNTVEENTTENNTTEENIVSNNIVNNTSTNSSSTNSSSANASNSSSAEKILPYTGNKTIIALSMIVVSISSVVAFIKYRKYNKI